MKVKTWLQMTLAATMLVASGAYAQFYVGAGGGYVHGSVDPNATAGNLTIALGVPTSTAVNDDDDMAWKLFLGYDLNQNLGFEFGYANLGKYGMTSTNATPTVVFTNLKIDVWYWDVIGKLPVMTNFGLYGKVGATYYTTDSTSSGVINVRDQGMGWKLGVGAQYDFTKNIAVRGEYERYGDMGSGTTTGKTDVDFFNAQILWKF
ncbi:MAG: outer membrane beta-barrel protein [Burkholderiales bacterium]